MPVSLVVSRFSLAAVVFFLSISLNAQTFETAYTLPLRQFGFGYPGFLAFSPDGQKILKSGSNVQLLDASSGEIDCSFLSWLSPQDVKNATLSSDGKYVVSAGSHGISSLWDASTGVLLQRYIHPIGQYSEVNAVTISPDGTRILTGGADKTAKLWDRAGGALLRTFGNNTGQVTAVAFSPDGKLALAGCGEENRAKIWNVETGALVRMFGNHPGSVNVVAFSPDGKLISAAGGDKKARVWVAATGQLIHTLAMGGDLPRFLAFSSDGTRLLAGSRSGAYQFDLAAGNLIRFDARYVYSTAFSSDGALIAFGNWNHTITLCDALTGAEVRTLGKTSALFWVRGVAYTPDLTRVLLFGEERADLWDARTGRFIRSFDFPWIYSVAFSRDGKFLLTGSGDADHNGPEHRIARLWDVDTGALVRTFNGHLGYIRSVALSPDGSLALTGGADGFVKLWNVSTGDLVNTFTGHVTTVSAVAFSPDGKFALTGGHDSTTRLWNVASGAQIRIDRGYTSLIRGVAFAPDGQSMICGDSNGALLRETLTGKTIRTYKTPVTDMTLSPDGTRLITAKDYLLRVWNVNTGGLLRQYALSYDLFGVAFSPDNGKVLVGNMGGTALELDVRDSRNAVEHWALYK